MKKVNEAISADISSVYDPYIERIDNKENILFFDIETTGLSPRNCTIYLIGAAYYNGGSWELIQFFAEKNADEPMLLRSFFELCKGYKSLVHFNGNRFDIPFIKARASALGIPSDETFPLDMESVDLYKVILPFKNALSLTDCKQKSIESFLGIKRQDIYSGKELIDVYKKYRANNSKELLSLLLLHNADDVRGMFPLSQISIYKDFFDCILSYPTISLTSDAPAEDIGPLPLRVVKAWANNYKDINGSEQRELMLGINLPMTLPSDFRCRKGEIFFRSEQGRGTLRIPIYCGELKYFYSDYKNYYYLPLEDQALHKSVAEFVDRSHRERATAKNCYTRKPGEFLPEWDLVFTPFFKKDYESRDLYFELTDAMKKSRSAMSLYACHIMSYLFS
ncbi:ribonuclease H-like domain-containing protein [Butyrivibrio sp. MC2013]|uniref:ribonuclease H-like domain-containing protein n=1 Tax=Butyrivibrio sp. MC2013 TaxID=1280686 RepID=UPI0004102FFF|nr:ribonuclease H-like domain-containing protein [Butyrivibrio sp. MC2013]